MANVTLEEQARRREKVKELWARGVRNLNKISDEVGSPVQTLKRDLVWMKRLARKNPITDRRLHLIREQIAIGYEKDIETLDEVIQKLKVKELTDPQGFSQIMRCKLDARKKLAELYQLLTPENGKLVVEANATAISASSAEINLNGISDADVIATTQGVLNRISETK